MGETNIFGAKIKMRAPGELTAAEREAGRQAMTDLNTRLLTNVIANRTVGCYSIGLDLGQAAEPSALAVLERQQQERIDTPRTFHCRHLQRWPLRTSYAQIIADTAELINDKLKSAAGTILTVDITGVGTAVLQLFRAQPIYARLQPVLITGGDVTSNDGTLARVPKRDLVTSTQVALQEGRLKIAPSLPDADLLAHELTNFRVKVTLEAGENNYGAWREGAQDDLVFAVMLALWSGLRPVATSGAVAGRRQTTNYTLL